MTRSVADPTACGDAPLEVLYIIGSGRSGSSLLGSLLGTHEAFFNSGEVYNYRRFFDTAKEFERLCSCGAPLGQCRFWENVTAGAEQRAGDSKLDLKHGDRTTLLRHNLAMLSTIRDTSGKRIIIDSSKRYSRLKLLMDSPSYRVTILHLVRDGRAFAYSTMLSAMKREIPYSSYFYKRLLKWQNKNIGIYLALRSNPGYHLVRYEDFARNPDSVLNRISGWYGETFDFGSLGSGEHSESHEFSGNKRFIIRNSLQIKQDTRYLEKLDSGKWLAATLLALPCLKLFRYPLGRNPVQA